MESRYFLYKMTDDNGGAPCVQNGFLSIAICKPRIRKAAKIGDWLIGVGGSRLENRFIYMAEVTDTAENGIYYTHPSFAGRPDRIYEFNSEDILKIRKNARYHSDGASILSDAGLQDEKGYFPSARVLISLNFRYLGKSGTRDLINKYPNLNTVVKTMKQGHRVNHSPVVLMELKELQTELWTNPLYQVTGLPSMEIPSICGGIQ